ncbi:MAG: hypothetical protein AAF492_10410, partial [Verrucomicrobiota bacterium]
MIPSNDVLYVSPEVNAFRARATGPSGGQGLFVRGNYSGHLSTLGETITLRGPDRTPVDVLSYQGPPSAQQAHLRISEVMFHPRGPEGPNPWSTNDFEFV